MIDDDIILKAENISKQYRLGLVGTGTLGHDLNRFWHKVRGKEDPYLKIGAVNDRSATASSDYVWALRDINFEVKRGEILGIIGKNGAGKSTLLKILSRVTSPTTGSIKTRGRIASLLEVGTGMHPELTGRENIFLNGAILGMTKSEIASKIDEIVEFSGCQMYIDTPVKRYSSGMRVRLGFAVAAFLEPDILVVDEVLAVGDAEFQKKAIGKMQDISSSGGRTVLFVSHNMAAVESLCSRAILLENGQFVDEGETIGIVERYLKTETSSNSEFSYESIEEAIGNESVKILTAGVVNIELDSGASSTMFDVTSPLDIEFEVVNLTDSEKLSIGFNLKTVRGEIVFGTGIKHNCPFNIPTKVRAHLPANFLNDESYLVHLYVHTEEMRALYSNPSLLTFQVKDVKRDMGYLGKIHGVIRPQIKWT
ncbi:ABC transporter ATP-binding protein [Nonlabens mediterrranea]|uniref:ABC transporter ATP-binding protein n=1 Tax=Nonlabens mediterrranea TaxID=1419947 RepID=A0ABS0A730_9FLAO|nr:ABC transporter ATP-binding protein [Nonlabens mediterrranea]